MASYLVPETNIDGTKNCLVCKLPYNPTRSNQQYCSVQCRTIKNNYCARQKRHNKPIIKYQSIPPTFEKMCPQCERVYQTKQRRRAFCSKTCRSKWLSTNKPYHTWLKRKSIRRSVDNITCQNDR